MEIIKISSVLQMIASYTCKDIALHSHVESSLEHQHLASCYCCVQHADKDLNDISNLCHYHSFMRIFRKYKYVIKKYMYYVYNL